MSLPALDQFPRAVWARLVARHAHGLADEQMAYGDPAGLVPLRTAIARSRRIARSGFFVASRDRGITAKQLPRWNEL